MVQITYIDHDGTTHNVDAEIGSTIMKAAVDNNIDSIAGECGGGMSCATCLCHVEGDWINKTGEATGFEKDMIELSADPQPNSRLGCQVEVTAELDGLIVHMPETQF